MNENTKAALKEFISAVEDLAVSVSSVAGTDTLMHVARKSEELRNALDSDETIP